jgi:predicted nucleic acid-binding protein
VASVFWDTNLFIYLLEDNPQFGAAVQDLRRRMLRRRDHLLTSTMTVGEILVKPLAANSSAIADSYREMFLGPQITVAPFDFAAAEAYARIRQDRSIRPADAIQLACASSAKVDLFITNDDRLSQKNIAGVNFITSLNRAPL